MTALLWVVFGLTAVSWLGAFWGWAYLASIPKYGNEEGPKAFAASLALLPVFMSAALLALPGGIAGLWLAARLDSPDVRFAVRVGAWIMLAGAAYTAARVLFSWWRSRRPERLLSQDEAIALIRSGVIGSFTKNGERVDLWYDRVRDPMPDLSWPARADADGYQAYVAAAKEVRDRYGVISFLNYKDQNDPSSPGSRWVGVEEASELLRAGLIKTFSYGESDPFPGETLSGAPTGIGLIDYGYVHHIFVGPALESTMIPIAREAQATNGKPQFAINGHYEPVVP